MQTILSFPALAGMAYPRLEEAGLMRIVGHQSEILQLPAADRNAIRIFMTSASRGCSAETIAALPNLGFVISQGAGTELLDMAGLAAKGIQLRCVGEALTDDVADLAMTLTHMLHRDLVRADAFARSGQWQHGRFELGHSVVGKTMGIAGLSGRIGQAIAARATVARMNIAGLDRLSNAGLNASLHKDWVELAAASDVLVLALPGTPELRHMVGAKELSALGKNGRLVNVGRGNLVDTDALIAALENNVIAGAALDVLDTEPIVPQRLAALPNVILTPHIGGQTWGQRGRGARIAEDAVLAFFNESRGERQVDL